MPPALTRRGQAFWVRGVSHSFLTSPSCSSRRPISPARWRGFVWCHRSRLHRACASKAIDAAGPGDRCVGFLSGMSRLSPACFQKRTCRLSVSTYLLLARQFAPNAPYSQSGTSKTIIHHRLREQQVATSLRLKGLASEGNRQQEEAVYVLQNLRRCRQEVIASPESFTPGALGQIGRAIAQVREAVRAENTAI
jgi:hypothetical protein